MNTSDFEQAIVGGIPMLEIARYMTGLKTAAKKVGPPDTTGVLEGQFAVPIEHALVLMGEIVKNEFETIYAYHVYAQSLRDLSHDSIAQHFEAHADEELGHADFLLKRMAVLGGPVSVPDVQAPMAVADPVEIIKIMIRMEQEAIEAWGRLHMAVGDNPMRVTIEEYQAKEQEHLDDLWQLLPQEANRPILAAKTAEILGGVDEPQTSENMDPYYQQAAQLEAAQRQKSHNGLRGALAGGIAGGVAGIPQAGGASYAAPTMAGALLGQSLANRIAPDDDRADTLGIVGGSLFGSGANLATQALGKYAPYARVGLGALSGAMVGNATANALSAPPPSTDTNFPKAAAANFRTKLAQMGGTSSKIAFMKRAFDGGVNQWMAQEQMMGQAQQQAEADYFKQQAQQAQAAADQSTQQAQATQQQLDQVQQQVQTMQQQLDQSGQQQRQILDQARMVEQAATQSAQSAHQTATASMLQSMQAQQEVMRHKGMTAQMQQNVQAWKDQLMGIAQADPTAGAGAQVGMPESGPIPPPQQPMDQMGASNPEAPQAAPTEMPAGSENPTEQAPAAEGNPNQPTPEGQGPQPQARPDSSAGNPQDTLAPAVSKTGAVDWAKYRQMASDQLGKIHPAHYIGAGVGAAAGAGLGYLSSTADPEKYKAKIKELQAKEDAGEGSFANSMNIARQQLMLAPINHPVGAAISGGISGLSLGAAGGASVEAIINHIRKIKSCMGP